jgi:hypothetical protein
MLVLGIDVDLVLRTRNLGIAFYRVRMCVIERGVEIAGIQQF